MTGHDGAGASAPASYPHEHPGAVLVCGFGPGFYGDFERARRMRPDAAVIAVNEAAKAVKAFALFTLHPEKARRWRTLQKQSFGNIPPLHSGGQGYDRRDKYPVVDYWWREAAGGGTSVWAAQRMARLMGFDERILVGAPLVYGNYADKSFAKAFREGQKREDGRDMLQGYRDYIAKDTEWHEGVTSMSGWTRGILGAPEQDPASSVACPRRHGSFEWLASGRGIGCPEGAHVPAPVVKLSRSGDGRCRYLEASTGKGKGDRRTVLRAV